MWKPGPVEICAPWHADGHANEWAVYNDNDWPMCNLVNDDGTRARLIAAAPDMLEELNWVGPFLDAMRAWLKSGRPFTSAMMADLEKRVSAVHAVVNKAERVTQHYQRAEE